MKTRDSNLELLRIVSMLMIIMLHYFSMGLGLENVTSYDKNYLMFAALYSLSVVGVNCFVLTTGYYSINSVSIKTRKILNLIIQVAFWGIVLYIISFLYNGGSLEVKEIVKKAVPYFFDLRWFVRTYIILLFFIPFINRLLKGLSRKSFLMLIMIYVVIFSVWYSFLPGSPTLDNGYGIINFILLYMVGSYIRMNRGHINKWICLLCYLVSVVCIIISSYTFLQSRCWGYSYIFVITGSIALFLFFENLNIGSLRLVNFMGKYAFGVYLIHSDMHFADILWRDNIKMWYGTTLFIPKIVGMIIFIYCVCVMLDFIREKLFSISVDKVLEKMKICNKTINVN